MGSLPLTGKQTQRLTMEDLTSTVRNIRMVRIQSSMTNSLTQKPVRQEPQTTATRIRRAEAVFITNWRMLTRTA